MVRLPLVYLVLITKSHQFYNVVAELQGADPTLKNEIIFVTAHIDSTGKESADFDPLEDLAPGADDDGSGIAAVLTALGVFVKLAEQKPPRRTVRFALFNAEEQGLVGSQKYVHSQLSQAEKIVAVFQMDMIGFYPPNLNPPRVFEIHAGFSSNKDVEGRSRLLAERIKRITTHVSPSLALPQIYPVGVEVDPAERRSDHASFQERGYAACVVSEDFFIGSAA